MIDIMAYTEKIERVLGVLPDTSDLLYARYKDATDKRDASDWYEHFLAVDNAIEIIRELKAENEQLKYEKEKAIRDIGLYIADAEEDARTPSRIGKGYYVGEHHGLQIAKEIVEGIRNHG